MAVLATARGRGIWWPSFARRFLSPGGQRWQNWHPAPLLQPLVCTKAQGLQPRPCAADPKLGRQIATPTGRVNASESLRLGGAQGGGGGAAASSAAAMSTSAGGCVGAGGGAKGRRAAHGAMGTGDGTGTTRPGGSTGGAAGGGVGGSGVAADVPGTLAMPEGHWGTAGSTFAGCPGSKRAPQPALL